jgi:Domain of unknown function (DUF6089)
MHQTRCQMLAVIVLFISFLPVAQAQMKGWETGVWVGVSNYFGDLNTEYRLNQLQLSGALGARYNFNDRLCLRFAANYGQLRATDTDSKNIFEQRRNLSFRSLIFDGAMQVEFNFLPYVHGHRELFYTPYMFLGPGVFYFNPQAELDGVRYDLVDFGTEGQFRGEEYSTFQPMISYGLGFKFDLSYRWSVNIELSGRRIFTDYIDDVSNTYADVRDLRAARGDIAVRLADRSIEPKIGEGGRQRGNGLRNDMYAMAHIGVLYYFGQIRCPAFLK